VDGGPCEAATNRARRLASVVAGRLVAMLGGVLWPREAAGEGIGVVDTRGAQVPPSPHPEQPAVDVLTDAAAVLFQDRPVLGLSSWLGNALLSAAEHLSARRPRSARTTVHHAPTPTPATAEPPTAYPATVQRTRARVPRRAMTHPPVVVTVRARAGVITANDPAPAGMRGPLQEVTVMVQGACTMGDMNPATRRPMTCLRTPRMKMCQVLMLKLRRTAEPAGRSTAGRWRPTPLSRSASAVTA
jgi:hypothetical protein